MDWKLQTEKFLPMKIFTDEVSIGIWKLEANDFLKDSSDLKH